MWKSCLIQFSFQVIWSFWYNTQYRLNVGYTIIALMTEVNSIFLHARKLMQLNKWPFEHWLYQMVVVLNLLTFVTFRLTGIVYIGHGILTERHRVTVTFAAMLSVAMFLMYIINPILLWRLVKNDVLRNLRAKQKYVHMNGNQNFSDITTQKVKTR